MSTDLIFSGGYTPPAGGSVNLLFGNAPGAPGTTVPVAVLGRLRLRGAVLVSPPATVTVAGRLRLRAAISVISPPLYPVTVLGRLRLRGAVLAHFDPAVTGILQSSVGVPWRGAAESRAGVGMPWNGGRGAHVEIVVPVTGALPERAAVQMPWGQASPRQAIDVLPWQGALAIERATVLPWAYGSPQQVFDVLPWRWGTPGERSTRLPWHGGLPGERSTVLPWLAGRPAERSEVLPWQGGLVSDRAVVLPWHDGIPVHTHGTPWEPSGPVDPPVDDPCYTVPPGGAVPLLFAQRWDGSTGLVFFCDNHPFTPGPPALVVVPIRKVYLVINETTLTRDGVAIPTLALQLALDTDAWTWTWSAKLPAAELANVAPDSDGVPVELVATLNGVPYALLAERIRRDRTFAVATIKVSGRGRNAILDSPYAATQSFGNATDRTAAQLLDDALTLNGESIGWTVEFGLDDWLVPAGAWALQGSHRAALTAIANAAGGYIQPHPTDDIVRVLHRYPTAPWDWGTVTPDFELPAAVTSVEGMEWVEKARYNRVYVSGTAQGVLGRITRAGTAGDVVAQMVTDALMTAAEAVTQRGRAILSDTGPVADVSLTLPVLPETGVITPGKFVRYVDEASVERVGIVRSTSVVKPGGEKQWHELWQTIGVETHE